MASWLFAQIYPWVGHRDPPGVRRSRRALFEGLSGEVLEIGAGAGLNFQFYPPGVSVIATDYSPHMLRKAEKAAARAPVPVELRQADVQALPFPDDTFDHTVATLVLCSVPDTARALTEITRVTRPGGSVRLLEHVAADEGSRTRRLQSWITPVWKRIGDGCELNRETVSLVEASPLLVDDVAPVEDAPRMVPMRAIRAHVPA